MVAAASPLPAGTPGDRAALGERPRLLRGAAAAWPAVRTWTPDLLADRFAALAVTPSVNLPDTEVPYQYRDRDYRRAMTLGELVRRMRAGERCYVDQMNIAGYPGLEADFDFAAFGPRDVKVIALWLGAYTSSGLHYDWVDNLFAQIHGTKQVVLAAPDQAPALYPFPDNHTKSQVAPLHPDLHAFPRFARAELFTGVVEPGDVLYIPKGWWHFFAAPGASISLTCWYGAQRTARQELGALLRLRSPHVWAGVARDFVWHGLLSRPYQHRLFSLPPSGLMLYEMIRQALRPRRDEVSRSAAAAARRAR